MTENVVLAIIAALGGAFSAILTAILTNKLLSYRIDQLEIKVDKHNNLIERTYKIEGDIDVIKADMNNLADKVRDAENDIDKVSK